MKQIILNFHGVGTPPAGTDSDELDYWIDEKPFLEALDIICAAGAGAKREVLITFDDGNISDAKLALPALVARGLKADFFVCAGRVGQKNYLDQVAISDLLSGGMGVGSHGMHHVNWRFTSDSELNAEIPVAIDQLAQICDRPIDSVAIPFGAYDRRAISMLRRQKLRSVFTSDGGAANANGWLKPRNTITRAWQNKDVHNLITSSDASFTRMRRSMSIAYKMAR